MADADISLVKYNFQNFWAVMLNSRVFSPISTLLIKIVKALISSEPEPDDVIKKRVEYLYENTHEKVNKPLAVVELAVFRNLDKGLNRTINLGDDEYTLVDLYQYLDAISLELSEIVIKIAKRYSLDIPLQSLSSGGKIDLLSEKM